VCTSTNLELVITLNVNFLKRSRFRPSSGTPLYIPTNASSPILQGYGILRKLKLLLDRSFAKSYRLFMQSWGAPLHLVCLEWEKGKVLKKHQICVDGF
jgi:hypothetical protein